MTSHSTSQQLTIELLSECKSHINANNPCLHFKANASQVGGSPCSLQKNRVGWFSILVHKENQNFISIVTNINFHMHWYIYSSVLKKIKFKSEIGIYLRFHNEYQKQVYLADKSPTTTSDLY